MKKLNFNQLIQMNDQKVLVKPYQESRYVKAKELNEMIVRTEDSQDAYIVHLCIEGIGGIYSIPKKCFEENVNNGTWIDIYSIE